jgi:hypothetical protein
MVTATKKSSRWVVSTLSDVGAFFGVHCDTPRTWRLGADPLPGTPGKWDLSAIAQWRARRSERSGLAEELRSTEIRLKTAMAVAKELANAQASGELLDRGDVERWASTAIIEFREMTMSLPERLATSAPPTLRGFIRDESDRLCRAALISLRRRLEMDRITDDVSTTQIEKDDDNGQNSSTGQNN